MEFPGQVYILENIEAQRVKIGTTISSVEERLIDVNRKWTGQSGTCQICGGRILVKRKKFKRIMPKHVVSGGECSGSEFQPLESDRALAKRYLEILKSKSIELSGVALGSISKKIKTLEDRIYRYENFDLPFKGTWRINTVYFTIRAYEVEKKTHKLLKKFIDKNVPLGEVFSCNIEEARNAVEEVLAKDGLINDVRVSVLNQDI